MIMLPIIRANKQIVITGGGMVNLTLEVFMAVRISIIFLGRQYLNFLLQTVKTSYSVLTILLNTNE